MLANRAHTDFRALSEEKVRMVEKEKSTAELNKKTDSSGKQAARTIRFLRNRIYYQFKGFIPRKVQIILRRIMVQRKRRLCANVWPIDEGASRQPEGWSGWPGQKQFALVLLHDVDTEVGHGRCRQLMELDREMGFRSLFSFVPEGYQVSPELRQDLLSSGFEVGVHGLKHDGKLFLSRESFLRQATAINRYIKEWNSVGFVSPSMHRNLDWMHDINIEYDASTFDTDPFEPQPDGVRTIFPFMVPGNNGHPGYVELPYTLPQDFTLFILMQEQNTDIWRQKLDWIVKKGGMALVITHPDYMSFGDGKQKMREYSAELYREFLDYVQTTYKDQHWNPLPKELAQFWKDRFWKMKNEKLPNQIK